MSTGTAYETAPGKAGPFSFGFYPRGSTSVVRAAKSNGASPKMVNHILIEELEAIETNLRAIYPPERVQAIVDELLVVYDAYKQWILPDSELNTLSSPKANDIFLPDFNRRSDLDWGR
jgi:hypothetical protein